MWPWASHWLSETHSFLYGSKQGKWARLFTMMGVPGSLHLYLVLPLGGLLALEVVPGGPATWGFALFIHYVWMTSLCPLHLREIPGSIVRLFERKRRKQFNDRLPHLHSFNYSEGTFSSPLIICLDSYSVLSV